MAVEEELGTYVRARRITPVNKDPLFGPVVPVGGLLTQVVRPYRRSSIQLLSSITEAVVKNRCNITLALMLQPETTFRTMVVEFVH